MVPPTSVSSRPSTVNSCSRVRTGERGTGGILWPSPVRVAPGRTVNVPMTTPGGGVQDVHLAVRAQGSEHAVRSLTQPVAAMARTRKRTPLDLKLFEFATSAGIVVGLV